MANKKLKDYSQKAQNRFSVVYIILGIIFVFFGIVVTATAGIFGIIFILFGLFLLVSGILVIKKNKQVSYKNITSNSNIVIPKRRSELDGSLLSDEIIVHNIDYIAKYKYDDVKIFTNQTTFNFQLYDKVNLIPEPQNQYDNKAIALYINDEVIGYLYKGTLQDMANDWFSRKEPIRALVSKIESGNVYIDIYFYKSIENILENAKEVIECKLISNKSANAQDNIGLAEENDELSIYYDNETETYEVYDGYSYSENEFIGKINKANSAKIYGSEDRAKVYISSIEENDDGVYSVYVKIYII